MSRIVIAGCGFAAGVMALRALQLRLHPILLHVLRPDVGGVEIIPAAARHLLDELELGPALAQAGARCAEGMLRSEGSGQTQYRSARALHVDRLRLREQVIAEACRRGTQVLRVDRFDEPPHDEPSVDASGRHAVWSKPLRKFGKHWADVFEHPATLYSSSSRISMFEGGWLYAASDLRKTGFAVIRSGRHRVTDSERLIRDTLALPDAVALFHLGRRPCFAQAAGSAIRNQVIAIGDAAFCHDPIGGRGLSFALGSAFAAGAVLQTWRERPQDASLATQYYRTYVDAEITRHMQFLTGGDTPALRIDIPARLVWIAADTECAAAFPDGIKPIPAAIGRDASPVRWLGKFDILTLKKICSAPIETDRVIEFMALRGLSHHQASVLIQWSLLHGMLADAEEQSSHL